MNKAFDDHLSEMRRLYGLTPQGVGIVERTWTAASRHAAKICEARAQIMRESEEHASYDALNDAAKAIRKEASNA